MTFSFISLLYFFGMSFGVIRTLDAPSTAVPSCCTESRARAPYPAAALRATDAGAHHPSGGGGTCAGIVWRARLTGRA